MSHFFYTLSIMTEQKTNDRKTHKYSALNYTLYLLSKRDYTEKQLRSKLKLKEYEAVEMMRLLQKPKSIIGKAMSVFALLLFAIALNKELDRVA